MKRVETVKAKEIEKILEERTHETIQIRKGCPDARFSKPVYVAYLRTFDGFMMPGTFGKIYVVSKTLQGLLSEPVWH